jgi:glutamate formiminotransferase/formiminotetrahydrofolate cyclodeaminase
MNDFENRRVAELLELLASDSPTPGGGTAAALAGAMGASLAQMVAALTLSKEKFAAAHAVVRPIADAAATAQSGLVRLAREDSDAYDAVVAARRLPKETEAQKLERQQAVGAANRRAAEIPLATAKAAVALLTLLPDLAEHGNPNAVSDAGAAALLLDASVQGALLNVGINLGGISDADFVAQMQRETLALQEESQRARSRVIEVVRKRF